MKRGQVSTEYLVIVGFITFIVLGILGVAFVYTSSVRDNIRINQLNEFTNKIITSAESVFYSGEPSKITLTAYIPQGVNNISIINNTILVNITTNSGINLIGFESNVPLQGILPTTQGVKVIELTAQENGVIVA